jgi:hypothetical protein
MEKSAGCNRKACFIHGHPRPGIHLRIVDGDRWFHVVVVHAVKALLCAQIIAVRAAMSHAIGSDSQRPFAIVIVGGLMVTLAMSIFILPTLYVWVAREGDKLPGTEEFLEA